MNKMNLLGWLICMVLISALMYVCDDYNKRILKIEQERPKQIVEHMTLYKLGNNYKHLTISGSGTMYMNSDNPDSVVLCDTLELKNYTNFVQRPYFDSGSIDTGKFKCNGY